MGADKRRSSGVCLTLGKRKRGAVSSLRLGMNPQAIWQCRIYPAFEQLEVIVIKDIRLILRNRPKAPFMGRSSLALAFRGRFRMSLTAVYRRSAYAVIFFLLWRFCFAKLVSRLALTPARG